MTQADSPRAVAEAILAHIDAGRWGELAAFYAENAVVEQPFALPAPVRIEGRAAIARHFGAAAKVPLALAVRNARFIEGTEPGTIVAEYEYELRAPDGGNAARVSNVQVFCIADGKVASSRDYHDHHRIGEAFAALRG
ncbi:MAG: nuclear transport factor 2 family protein [Sphingomonas sp.]